MSEKELIIAVFPDEATADAAVMALHGEGITHEDAMGVLVLDEDGNIKADKVGKRSTGAGAGVGVLLGLLGPVGIGIGAVGGAVGGGLLGHLHHKGLGLDETDRERISAELTGGKAAVGVLAPMDDAGAIEARLAELGGSPEQHAVPSEALEAATASTA